MEVVPLENDDTLWFLPSSYVTGFYIGWFFFFFFLVACLLDRKAPAHRYNRLSASVASYAACRGG